MPEIACDRSDIRKANAVADAKLAEVEVADVHIGSHKFSGQSFSELSQAMPGGVTVQAIFRAGNEVPLGPKSDVRFGDVLRLTGPDAAIQKTAAHLGGRAILPTMKSEVLYLSLAMLVGYLIGIVTVTISGIPMRLAHRLVSSWQASASAIFVAETPSSADLPMKGARSFLQDFGLNAIMEESGSSGATVPGNDWQLFVDALVLRKYVCQRTDAA